MNYRIVAHSHFKKAVWAIIISKCTNDTVILRHINQHITINGLAVKLFTNERKDPRGLTLILGESQRVAMNIIYSNNTLCHSL